MATAGERLAELRKRIRLYDKAVNAERIEVIGRAFTEGAVPLPVKLIEMVAKSCHEKAEENRKKALVSPKKARAPGDKKAAVEHHEAAEKHEADRKLVEPEGLKQDGYKLEENKNGTVCWRGPREWPGIPQRPPPTRRDGAQAGASAGRGDGGSSAAEPAPRPSTLQERLDAQAWDEYYESLSDKDEWIKRQKRRGWVVGECLLATAMNTPEIRRVFRKLGGGRAQELFKDGWPGSTDSSS